MNKKFFMIYVEGKNSSTVKHYSYEDALEEAKRLAIKTNSEVYILEAIKKVELNNILITDLIWLKK